MAAPARLVSTQRYKAHLTFKWSASDSHLTGLRAGASSALTAGLFALSETPSAQFRIPWIEIRILGLFLFFQVFFQSVEFPPSSENQFSTTPGAPQGTAVHDITLREFKSKTGFN
jgi:hypothetical protein